MERLSSYFHPIETGDARWFLAGVIELFARYPQVVVDRALDVSIGLPGKYKFWPRISEIKEMLDDLHRPVQFKIKWDAQARQQIAERETMLQITGGHAPALEPPPVNRMGLSQAEWDAIPNADPPGLKPITVPTIEQN